MARPTLLAHRKFARLSAQLGGDALALGHLELLWMTCYESGDDVVGDSLDVEAAARWRGEPGELVAALLNAGGAGRSGFLDVEEEASEEAGVKIYSVHDLWVHAPDYVQKRAKREAERNERGQTLSEIRREAGRKGGKKSAAARSKRLPVASEDEASGGRLLEDSEFLSSKKQANVRTPAPAPAPAPAQELLAPTSGRGERKVGVGHEGNGDHLAARRDPLYEVLLQVCDIRGEPTKRAISAYRKALAELRDVGASPVDVHDRAAIFRRRWPQASLTPTALARRWAECGPGQRRYKAMDYSGTLRENLTAEQYRELTGCDPSDSPD